jgi:hypothetical protein
MLLQCLLTEVANRFHVGAILHRIVIYYIGMLFGRQGMKAQSAVIHAVPVHLADVGMAMAAIINDEHGQSPFRNALATLGVV